MPSRDTPEVCMDPLHKIADLLCYAASTIMKERPVAQPLRRSAESPIKASRLAPAPPPADAVNGMESAQQLLKRFEKLARTGGTFTTDAERKPYAFYGGLHLSASQVIQAN